MRLCVSESWERKIHTPIISSDISTSRNGTATIASSPWPAGRMSATGRSARAGDIPDIGRRAGRADRRVDAAIVCSRDGRKHREQATTLLDASSGPGRQAAGMRAFPTRRRFWMPRIGPGSPSARIRALRWAAPVTELAAKLAQGDPPDLVAVTGPADASSEYGGIFFYGIHVVEIASMLAPERPIEDVSVTDLGDTVVVTARAGSTRLLLEMVRPDSRKQVPSARWSRPADPDRSSRKCDCPRITPSPASKYSWTCSIPSGCRCRTPNFAPVALLQTVAEGVAK